jgi:LCP family protein required for cell wall assembly
MTSTLTSLPTVRRRRLVNAWSVAMILAVAGLVGLTRSVDATVDASVVIEEVSPVLSTPGPRDGLTIVLVGSDSRSGVDPDAPDAAALGTTAEVTGRRSDTVMLLRRDPDESTLAVVSLPRDLWVDIPGWRTERINAAYSRGPEFLVATVTETLGIPVHHYVEVDLVGFQSVVEALDGVEICVDTPVRDTRSGLSITTSGCHRLDGISALAYVRSRAYERFENGSWTRDPTADIGRTQRQRIVVAALVERIGEVIAGNPFAASTVVDSLMAVLGTDPGFDPVEIAGALGRGLTRPIESIALPVRPDTVEGKSVLRLAAGADEVLAWLGGQGPRPS